MTNQYILNPQKNTLIIIGGPTASGKTDIAIEVAKHFKTEIISADSRQLFKELQIGTAKPNEEQLAAVKHHFISSHSIHDEMNTGIYETQCTSLLNNLFKHHKILVMVGGTGLYINAVVNGLDSLPVADKNIRMHLEKELKANGIGFLQKQLLELDPDSYQKIDLQNPARLMRAMEVCLSTGKPYSSFLKKEKTSRNFTCKFWAIDRDRKQLYENIDNRVDNMMRNGLLKEVEKLYAFKNLNALRTVGYSELFDFFENKISLENAIGKIKQHTRNYAKRQITWFKKAEGIRWVSNTEMILNTFSN